MRRPADQDREGGVNRRIEQQENPSGAVMIRRGVEPKKLTGQGLERTTGSVMVDRVFRAAATPMAWGRPILVPALGAPTVEPSTEHGRSDSRGQRGRSEEEQRATGQIRSVSRKSRNLPTL